jgi:putative endonuclease
VAAGFTRWPLWRRWFGSRSEKAAATFLRRLGYRVLAANVNETVGEIDLLALDDSTIIVVEVRSTESDDLHRAAASVNRAKQRKVIEAAVRFLSRHRLLGHTVRFDVLAISWPATAREPTFLHIPHAFEVTDKFLV